MAKGAGMLAPGLATMLVVLTTDAVVDAGRLDAALRHATGVTFDRVDSDGCMSTNDTVLLLASGASGVAPTAEEFTAAVTAAAPTWPSSCSPTPRARPRTSRSTSAARPREDDAVEVGRAVARNNLVKTALFGKDPNWGRMLAAVGTTDAAFDPDQLDVAINGVQICRDGAIGEDRATVDLDRPGDHVDIDLQAGAEPATILTNDLSPPTSTRTGPTRHDAEDPTETPLDDTQHGAEKLGTAACADDPRRRARPTSWPRRCPGCRVPRQHRRGQVRRQRDGRRRAAGARSPRTWCSCAPAGIQPVVVHGGGPQITAMLDRLGIAERVPRRPAGHHAGDDGHRADGAGRPGRPGAGRADQPARPVRRRHVRRGRAACSPPRRTHAVVDGEAVDIGLVGDVVEVDPAPCTALLDAGRIPVVSTRRAGRRRRRAQHQRRHRGRRARRRAGRGEARRAHRRRGPLRRLAGPRLAGQQIAAASWPSAARPGRRHGAQDGGLPARGARRRRRGARPRRAGPAPVLLEIFTDDGIGTMVVPARRPRRRCQRMTVTEELAAPLVGAS